MKLNELLSVMHPQAKICILRKNGISYNRTAESGKIIDAKNEYKITALYSEKDIIYISITNK